MNLPQRSRGLIEHRLQQGQRRLVLPFKQETMSSLTVPRVGMLQQADKL